MEKLLTLSVKIEGTVLRVHVKNRSAYPLNLWSRSCSWGWETISLQVTMPKQQHLWHKLTVMPIRWTVNYPQIVKLLPNGLVAFDFPVGVSVWKGVEAIDHWQDKSFLLRAKLRIEETKESVDNLVLSGEVQSPSYLSKPPHCWLFNTND